MEERNERDIPEGFTLSMALMDTLPVFFFAMSAGVLSVRFPSVLFRTGATLVILAGAMKASWKFVLALARKDIPFLNRQMRSLMPAGFLLMFSALGVDHAKWSAAAVLAHIMTFPSWLFFLLAAAGIVCLCVFARVNSQTSARDNWIEQGTNAVTQLCVFLGILL